MAAEARTRSSVKVESAEIAGNKISSVETSLTVTAGLGLGLGCRAKAFSVVLVDVRDPPLEARSGLLLVTSVFEVDVGWLSEKFPCFLLKEFFLLSLFLPLF